MFSKEYFTYLIKSRKYLLLFIIVASLLNGVGTSVPELGIIIQGFYCVLLTYIIPCNVFYYVHDKKAVDTFFSIPVSRRKMLITGIIFSVLATYIPFVICFSFYGVVQSIGIAAFFIDLLKILLVACTLVVFNTCLYLIGNNSFDGIVMIGAYSVLPLAVFVALNIFSDAYIAGGTINTTYAGYLSPVFVATDLFFDIIEASIVEMKNVIALFVYLIVFAILLYKSYVNRDVERAGTTSNKIYSYPTVIYIYVFLMMFIISSNYSYSYNNFTGFLSDSFFMYLMLFIVYVAAHFVYKRKLYFNYKLPLAFIIAFVLTISFISVARTTKGFGLSEAYKHNDKKANWTFNMYYNDANRYPKQIVEAAKEAGLEEVYYLSIYVHTGDTKYVREMRDSTLEVLEKYRVDAIDKFYSNIDDGDWSTINIFGSNGYHYYYSMLGYISYDDLCTLAKDPLTRITIDVGSAEMVLNYDGTLKVTTIYYDAVTESH